MARETLTLSRQGVLDRVASTVARRAVTAPVQVPEGDPRVGTKLDRTKPFVFVSDGTNRAYQQGNGYFNKVDQWIGGVPSGKVWDHAQPENPTVDARRAEILASAKMTIGKLESVPRVPASVLDAYKENERARKAEDMVQ